MAGFTNMPLLIHHCISIPSTSPSLTCLPQTHSPNLANSPRTFVPALLQRKHYRQLLKQKVRLKSREELLRTLFRTQPLIGAIVPASLERTSRLWATPSSETI